MKLLHTADWHLGQRFFHYDRETEHAAFLQWLLDTIEQEQIDLLLIAGDIFDVGNPPAYALRQYYQFLHQLQHTCCQHTVIIGGNHDFASTLNQANQLLKLLNVHVLGCTPWRLNDPASQVYDEILPLSDTQGELFAVVAAVPFLRERDLKLAVSGETLQIRAEHIRQGIANHYATVWDAVQPWRGEVPLIAMGHLFAAGALLTEDSEREIQCGYLGGVPVQALPLEFDYIALGHLHRAQSVGDYAHVRYAGAPIPLGFRETVQPKTVTIAEFSDTALSAVRTCTIPETCYRPMLRFSGDLAQVKAAISKFQLPTTSPYAHAWAEISLQLETRQGDEEQQLAELAEAHQLEVLKFKLTLPQTTSAQTLPHESLATLTPEQVFLQRCSQEGYNDTQQESLLLSFRELWDVIEAGEAG